METDRQERMAGVLVSCMRCPPGTSNSFWAINPELEINTCVLLPQEGVSETDTDRRGGQACWCPVGIALLPKDTTNNRDRSGMQTGFTCWRRTSSVHLRMRLSMTTKDHSFFYQQQTHRQSQGTVQALHRPSGLSGADLKKFSFSATTVNPVAWDRSRLLLLTRLPVFSRYSTCAQREHFQCFPVLQVLTSQIMVWSALEPFRC